MAWISRMRALFLRDKLAKELQEEMEFHLSHRAEWNGARAWLRTKRGGMREDASAAWSAGVSE